MSVTIEDLEPVDSAPAAAEPVRLEDLEEIDAPNNSVYHEPSGRVLSLPQSLDAPETQYTIDKQIDGKSDFFGLKPMTHTDAMDSAILAAASPDIGISPLLSSDEGKAIIAQTPEALGAIPRKAATMVGRIPSVAAGLGISEAERAQRRLQSGETVESMKAGLLGTPNVIRDLVFGSEETLKAFEGIRERNLRWLDSLGLNKPEKGPAAQLISDVSGGIIQGAGQVGFGLLMGNVRLGTIVQTAFVKSDSYMEGRQEGLSPDEAEDYSNYQAAWNLASEYAGNAYMLKSVANETAARAAKKALISEGAQEGVQSPGQDLISNAYGVTDLSTFEILKNAGYSTVVGSLSGAAVGGGGAYLAQSAEQRGINAKLVTLLESSLQEEVANTPQLMAQFLEREVRPIADDNNNAAKFFQMMNTLHNDPSKADTSSFSEQELDIFDHFLRLFNESAANPQGVQSVEKSFYDMATTAGLDKEQAFASAKLLGMRSEAAARALGVTPMEWYKNNNLELEVQRTPQEAMQSYEEKLAALNAELPDAPGPDLSAEQGIKTEDGYTTSYSTLDNGVNPLGQKETRVKRTMVNPDGTVEITEQGDDGIWYRNGQMPENVAPLIYTSEVDAQAAIDEDFSSMYPNESQLPNQALSPEDEAIKAEEMAGYEKRLNDANSSTRDVSVKKPIIRYLKSLGGIRTDGLIYGELKYLGIDRKSAVGLFKNNDTAMRDIDNIPVEEFNRALGVAAKDDGNGYVDRDWLLEALRDEQFGTRMGQERPVVDDSFIQALDKAGLDYRTATAQEVYDALGPDADIVAAAADMGIELMPREVRLIRGLMDQNQNLDVRDAIDEFAERSAIMGETLYQRDDGQSVLPGAEKVTDKQLAEKGMEGRMKSSKAQKPMDEGMFGDGFKQQTLFQTVQREQTLQRLYEYDLLDKLEMLAGYKGRDDKKEAFLERARANALTEADLALNKEVLTAAKRVGGRMFQSKDADTNSEAFKKWFGDSKVVTAEGKPQVVYHGTDKSFGAFNPKKGAQQIIWFTSSKADIEAGEVGASGKGRIIEMYAKIEKPAGWKDYDNLGLAELEARGFDGVILPEKDGSFTGFAFEPTQFKATNNRGTFDPNDKRLLFQEGARGAITFGRDRTLIQLFKDANPSTILHELGHFFLRDMAKVSAATRRPQVKKDFDVVKDWLGSKDGKFTEDQEEKFARGFEAYLREGKAPKEGLQAVFDRFKKWLTGIYSSVKDLNVEINDDVRAVFDRMLGADYAKAESAVQQREAAKIEADYAAVVVPPPSSLGSDAGDVLASAKQLAGNIFTPISSRLGRIDPKLKAAVRRYTFETGMAEQRDRERALPFLNAIEKMDDADYRMLDFALKNRDTQRADELMKKYGMEKEFQAIRDLLDDIYNKAVASGLDVSYLDDYFPRMVHLSKASDYLSQLRGRPDWSLIKEALAAEDPMNVFTDEEKAVFVNKWLRGHASAATYLTKPSFIKDRVIDYVEPQNNQFYLESGEALLKYISAMRLGIAQREIFGKGESVDESIGAYVLNLVNQGAIDYTQENEVKMLMQALVNSKGPGVFVSWMKNVGYVYLMGSPISAITQIGDLAFSLAKNGYYRTGVSVVKAIAGKSVLTKEELGIDNIAQEFEDNTRASAAVRKVFQLTGLSWMDNIGKQTFIESSYKRLRAEAKKNGAPFKKTMREIFGEDAESVRKDLMDGTLSDNVKMLLYSELSDMQPVSLAEMPVGYLRGGNWRSLYMLKTYTVKQIDIYRREIFDKLATGEPSQVKEGMAMMLRLSIALMLTGMGADALKDLILGRAMTLSDTVMDNLLKLSGLTKYQIYQSRQDGIGNTLMQMMFVPPLYAPFDNLIKDVQKVTAGKITPKDALSLSYVPIVGKFYYWWYGGGRAKEERKAGKKAQ